MTEIRADNIQDRAGTGKPDFDTAPTHSGGSALSTLDALKPTYTSASSEPSSPSNGDLWWDSANSENYIYVNNEWRKITLGGSGTAYGAGIAWGGNRALHGGGDTATATYINNIDYWDMTSSGNASDFGDLQAAKGNIRSGSSTTRGLWAGGSITGASSNQIDYVTISTTGNATDFGDILSAQAFGAVHSDGVKLFVAAGNPSTNVIQYVTIATTGNAADWGDLTYSRMYIMASGDATRGLATGSPLSSDGGGLNVIDYWSTQSAGNAADFGDLTENRRQGAGASDATRAVFGGGYQDGGLQYANVIDYVTVQTLGNAIDFGDLISTAATNIAATSNGTIGHWAGGASSTRTNTIQQITIQTTGNASDFGDLLASVRGGDCCSGSPS